MYFIYSREYEFIISDEALDRSNAMLIAGTIDEDNKVYAMNQFTDKYLLYTLKSVDSPC